MRSPGIAVSIQYLAVTGNLGFNDIAAANDAARQAYAEGADIVFAAAGDAGLGVFAAAAETTAPGGPPRWAIGVDSDQYETVDDNPANVDAPRWRAHILTSVLKRTDVAVHDIVSRFANGDRLPRLQVYGVQNKGTAVAYSGGYLNDLRPTIETWRDRLAQRDVVAPCTPLDRHTLAAQRGLPPDYCTI